MWGGQCIADSLEKVVPQVILPLIKDANLQNHEKQFESIESGSKRVDFIYNILKKSNCFGELAAKQENKKSNSKSLEVRTKGNDLYIRKRRLMEALECYTESIAYAEGGTSFLGIAYANRSAILFESRYYNECLMDIEKALQNDYPDNLKEKLLRRKEKAIKLKAKQKQIVYYTPAFPIQNKNPQICAAADSVEIKKNTKYGRHVVATKNIKVGDVISAEESFAHVIHVESRFLHCHECLNICYNMIPCEKCPALYCGEVCREQAFNTCHKYECDFPDILDKYPQLFVRIAIKGLKEQESSGDAALDETFRSDRFKEINELATNENQRDFLNTCIHLVIVCLSYHSLVESITFQSDFDVAAINDSLMDLLYRTYMIHSFNPFNIKKIKYTMFDVEMKRVGTAIYAFASMFNHSCVPNCEFFHHGTALVMRAIANIKKGEQCCISYGISFATTEISDRRMMLKRSYLFDCDCKACANEWPIQDFLPLGKPLPVSFEKKVASHSFENPNQTLVNEMLAEAIRLYNAMERLEPCQTLLRIQNLITEIYTYLGCKCLDL